MFILFFLIILASLNLNLYKIIYKIKKFSLDSKDEVIGNKMWNTIKASNAQIFSGETDITSFSIQIYI